MLSSRYAGFIEMLLSRAPEQSSYLFMSLFEIGKGRLSKDAEHAEALYSVD